MDFSTTSGFCLPLAKAELLGEKLASSIVRHWRPTSVRLPAKVPRAQRERIEDAIVKRHLAAIEQGAPLSRRALAKELEIGPNTVQRVLKARGLVQGGIENFSPDAAKVYAVLNRHIPVDGRRAVPLADMANVVGLPSSDLLSVLKRLSEVKGGFTVTETDVPSGTGTRLLVIGRGRHRRKESDLQWLKRAELARSAPHRSAARPSQNHYSYWVTLAVPETVQRDLLAVIMIAGGSRNVVYWKDFIEASCGLHDIGSLALHGADRGAIVTVVQSALRMRQDDIARALRSAERWFVEPNVRASGKGVLRLAQKLIGLNEEDVSLQTIMVTWAEEVGYVDRIVGQDLVGRSLEVAEMFLSSRSISDDEIESMLMKALQPSLPRTAINAPAPHSDHPENSYFEEHPDDAGYIYPLEDYSDEPDEW